MQIFTIRFLQNLQKNWMMRFVEELSILEVVTILIFPLYFCFESSTNFFITFSALSTQLLSLILIFTLSFPIHISIKINIVTTSKIRNLLAMNADIYNQVLTKSSEKLDDEICGRIEYLRGCNNIDFSSIFLF